MQYTSISISATFTTTGPAGTPVGWMFREDLYTPVRIFISSPLAKCHTIAHLQPPKNAANQHMTLASLRELSVRLVHSKDRQLPLILLGWLTEQHLKDLEPSAAGVDREQPDARRFRHPQRWLGRSPVLRIRRRVSLHRQGAPCTLTWREVLSCQE